MSTERNCKCGDVLQRAPFTSFTGIDVKAMYKCRDCGAQLLIIPVIAQKDLEIWLDEKNPSEPFTEFVERKLEERRYN